jgi:Zn-finger nucleic acid-binding protein
MKCPVCSVDLVMADRQGVEIDYCPKCRGVWLDRGELDKIIERSTNAGYASGSDESRVRAPTLRANDHDPRRDQHGDEHQHQARDHDEHGRPHGKKRKSFLSDFFEFD